jgi:hypothetical protein
MRDTHTRRLGLIILILTFAGTTGIPRDIVPKAVTAVTGDFSNIMFGTLIQIVYFAVIMIHPARWNIRCRPHASPAPIPLAAHSA